MPYFGSPYIYALMDKDWLTHNGMHDGAIPQIFRNAARLRRNMTEPEKVLWEYLRRRPLGFKFRRQHPIKSYVLDFYCHKKRLSIEVDGDYHLATNQNEKDKDRTAYLHEVGIKEIRFKNEEVLKELSKVKLKIENELRADTPY